MGTRIPAENVTKCYIVEGIDYYEEGVVLVVCSTEALARDWADKYKQSGHNFDIIGISEVEWVS